MHILTTKLSGRTRAGLMASLVALIAGVALLAGVLLNADSSNSGKSPREGASANTVPPVSAAQTANLVRRFELRIDAPTGAPRLTESQAASSAQDEMPYSGTIAAGSLVVATLPGENSVPRLDWLFEIALNPSTAPQGHGGPPPHGSASPIEAPRSNFAAVLIDATTGQMAGAFDGYDPQLPPLPTPETEAGSASPAR